MENVTNAIVRNLQPRSRDLLEIAAYVYLADTEVVRWSERDLLNKKWVRDFHFVIPVSDPAFWSSAPVSEQLSRTLGTASGDTFSFTFAKGSPSEAEQLFTGVDTPFPGADTICLFSGGADSLAGVVYACESMGKHPLLVSHRSSSRLDSRQGNLRELLNQRRGTKRPLSHVSVWLNRDGSQAKETSQRTRGFLFLTLATVIARELGISQVIVPENGPVSINLRKLQQSYGATLSRTTHPALLAEYQTLVRALGGTDVSFVNPFLFSTKTDVLGVLDRHGVGDLLQESVSCAHIQGQTNAQPHCGVCSQCIDRRVASIAACMEAYDPSDRYEHDIFTEAVPDGEPRQQVESHARLIARILTLSEEALADEFSDLAALSTALPGPASKNAERLMRMMMKYALDYELAFERQFIAHKRAVITGKLPGSCLLRLSGPPATNSAGSQGPPSHRAGTTTLVNIHHEVVMRDKYTTSQAGAVGPGSHAHDMSFAQVWHQAGGQIDISKLSEELSELRSALKNAATTEEQDIAVGEVSAAALAARSGDGPTTLSRLANAGSWALDVAVRIGVPVAVEALKRALGIPPTP
ncbi:MAG TPA: hypothetical protein VFK04_15505 [Gemmatimonadaceae bacterium]|nr:hypothetical protein [Gemmatimonadaceae bacterium]